MNTNSVMNQESFKTGLLYGLGAMLIGAIGWALVAYLLDRVFLYGGVIIGFLVAYAISTGAGNIDKNVMISTFILTICSVILGDFLSILLVLILDFGVPLNLSLITALINNFIAIEMEGGVISILFSIFGAFLAVIYLSDKQKLSITKEGVPIFTEKKPFFDLSPKWIVPIMLSSQFNSIEKLTDKLLTFGFLLTKEDAITLRFERMDKKTEVKLKGPKGKLTIIIPLPIDELVDMVEILLLYSSKVYFDTGDLWQAANDLKNQLQDVN